jgi:hypothetical protein
LSIVLGQHKEENDNEQLLDVVFCNVIMQKKLKIKKLTKGGRVQNVPRDIGNGNGAMELMLE